jgi:hypothetical protein
VIEAKVGIGAMVASSATKTDNCCDVYRKPSGALFGRICVYCERDGHLPRYSERRVIVPPTLGRRSALN